jgi:hypothetical protein
MKKNVRASTRSVIITPEKLTKIMAKFRNSFEYIYLPIYCRMAIKATP